MTFVDEISTYATDTAVEQIRKGNMPPAELWGGPKEKRTNWKHGGREVYRLREERSGNWSLSPGFNAYVDYVVVASVKE